MYSKLGNGTAWLIILFICSFTHKIYADDNVIITGEVKENRVAFLAKPANCVALHQGRKCYATVSLLWETSQLGNYCIYQKLNKKIIQCWKNSKGNTISFEFQSSEKLEYQLIESVKNQVFAETVIDVSWVHKSSPRKRRWRLF